MRALCLSLIILEIVYAGTGCASIHLPPYTLDQETSDTIGTVSQIGEGAADVAEAGYAIDKAAAGRK
jgi:hypothetical protein